MGDLDLDLQKVSETIEFNIHIFALRSLIQKASMPLPRHSYQIQEDK